ncbi:hypothetical protein L3V79_04735 [Thiotrichales bacterium 19S9-12]|nr:hypothetical protein [Thiotrichales bacterium 19S9-11]MCF6811664.1 hypothetical protein [Thiotrichales bacterium 19S9-12]
METIEITDNVDVDVPYAANISFTYQGQSIVNIKKIIVGKHISTPSKPRIKFRISKNSIQNSNKFSIMFTLNIARSESSNHYQEANFYADTLDINLDHSNDIALIEFKSKNINNRQTHFYTTNACLSNLKLNNLKELGVCFGEGENIGHIHIKNSKISHIKSNEIGGSKFIELEVSDGSVIDYIHGHKFNSVILRSSVIKGFDYNSKNNKFYQGYSINVNKCQFEEFNLHITSDELKYKDKHLCQKILLNDTKLKHTDISIELEKLDLNSYIHITGKTQIEGKLSISLNTIKYISDIILPGLRNTWSRSYVYKNNDKNASSHYRRLYEYFSEIKHAKYSGIFYALYFANAPKLSISWLYWKLSDAGISYVKPIIWLIIINVICLPFIYVICKFGLPIKYDISILHHFLSGIKYSLIQAMKPFYLLNDLSKISLLQIIVIYIQLLLNILFLSLMLIALRWKFRRQ